MAVRKAKKSAKQSIPEPKKSENADATPVAESAASTPARRQPKPKRTGGPKGRGLPPKVRASKAGARKRRAAPKRSRKASSRRRYTDQERRTIVAAAKRKGLTGAQVQKEFGVSSVTYYLWRKAGTKTPGRKRAGRVRRGPYQNGQLAAQVRQEVQAKVREILPLILREEVAAYVGVALGGMKR